MQKEFHLSRADVGRLAGEFGTPLLVMSVEQVKQNYRYLKDHMPRVNLHYAVKANPDERIVRTLKDLGSCFDVASDGEILQLQALGIEGARMVYANPAVKRLTGLGPEDIVGKTLDENFPGLRAKGIPQRFAEVVRSQSAISFEDITYGDERVLLASSAVRAFPLPREVLNK